MIKYNFFLFAFLMLLYAGSDAQLAAQADRQIWLKYMDKVAAPVLSAMAEDRLKETMPVVLSPHVDNKDVRSAVTYLEAFARTLSGIAPWLNGEGGSKEETIMRNRYREWALKALAHAVDPSAKDYLKWDGGQPLVDASFLALALNRCPWLWEHLDTVSRSRLVTAFKTTRATVPVYSNWILFSGMIEAFFCKYGLDYDPVRIEFGVREFFQHWYTGDGQFSDGMNFHWDYYNSYVIQPYLGMILEIMHLKKNSYGSFITRFNSIRRRYAVIQERLIGADGSFPVIGRSICYRGGAFHHLADMALRQQLPAELKPAQVRSALTAVLKKTLDPVSSFTKTGWLNIGLYGNQPGLSEGYITTGSLYLCSEIFLPLGLPDANEFWSAPPEPWTQVKAWRGDELPADHALDLN
jgi:hypothetical protein